LPFQKYVLFVRNENSFKPSNINKKKFDNVNYCLIYVISGIKMIFDDLQCNSRSELSSVLSLAIFEEDALIYIGLRFL